MMNTGRSCTKNDACGGNEVCCAADKNLVGNVCLKDGEVATDNEPRTCHVMWDKDNESDWFKNGKCMCKPGYTYISSGTGIEDGVKLCVPDQCHAHDDEPGNSGFTRMRTNGDAISCECPATSKYPISCPSDLPEDPDPKGNTKMFRLKNVCNDFPMCISDPCADYGGKYKKEAGAVGGKNACDCPAGTISDKTKTNWTGSYCDNPCQNNGPCGTGSSKRGTCRVVQRGDKREVECVRPEVANANCDGRNLKYCDYDGLCKKEGDRCVDLPPGAGGCLCPWSNPCNEHTDEATCKGQNGMCTWLGGDNPKSIFTSGQQCVLSDDYLDIEINVDANGNKYRPYTNTCYLQEDGLAKRGQRCIKGAASCCNRAGDDVEECKDSILDFFTEDIHGVIGIGKCGAII